MSEYQYPGKELDLFDGAVHWKRYLKRHIAPFLKSPVLEVGAGLGGTTAIFYDPSIEEWTALEPDGGLYGQLAGRAPMIGSGVHPVNGDLGHLGDRNYHSILYIDVLEHIENDREELAAAARRLQPGGNLIVLSPAFPFLFTAFDTAIGHYRRYTRRSLKELQPHGTRLHACRYLDCAGFFASCANKLVLKQQYPTRAQVKFWDRKLVPVSRMLDPVLHPLMGKSILGIWQKEVAP